MPEEKNFFAGLFDFAFHHSLLRSLVKLLYVIGIIGGGIFVVARVVLGYQQSPADALINLITRLFLELALLIMRIAEGIERATRTGV